MTGGGINILKCRDLIGALPEIRLLSRRETIAATFLRNRKMFFGNLLFLSLKTEGKLGKERRAHFLSRGESGKVAVDPNRKVSEGGN